MYKRLYKSRNNIKIDGVCAGLADYFNMDPTLIRIIWVFATLFTNVLGILAYVLCSVIIPREPAYFE
ncbi:PspC domain-containing protein [Anaeropeptidivorans aminofermentans]|jgi:phage shock protein C|uniref:PspC domain-containing protein n=1 Tax=Anaeropeptidivorans aminofermentans TaxID=2934315 RepID=UPI0020249E13|nr:PspC domain-containing protein [Anaeropeptidivorans aminofermentans]MBE6013105.1 PspC domain-containing protein [Lachnospiraceae bacterium]